MFFRLRLRLSLQNTAELLNPDSLTQLGTKIGGRSIIVSRDGDYGTRIKDDYFLNDQLRHEYRERAGKKGIEYTHRLSSALKELKVAVPKKEVDAESDALRQSSTKSPSDGNTMLLQREEFVRQMLKK